MLVYGNVHGPSPNANAQCRWSKMSTLVHLLVGNHCLCSQVLRRERTFDLDVSSSVFQVSSFSLNISLWHGNVQNVQNVKIRLRRRRGPRRSSTDSLALLALHRFEYPHQYLIFIPFPLLAYIFAPPFLHSGFWGLDGGGSKDGIWEAKGRTSRPRVGIYF